MKLVPKLVPGTGSLERGVGTSFALTRKRFLLTFFRGCISAIPKREPVGNQLGTSLEKGTSF